MYSVQYNIYDTYENVLDFCFPDSQGGRDEYLYSIKVQSLCKAQRYFLRLWLQFPYIYVNYFIGAGTEICKPDYHKSSKSIVHFSVHLPTNKHLFRPPFNTLSKTLFPLPKKTESLIFSFPFLEKGKKKKKRNINEG